MYCECECGAWRQWEIRRREIHCTACGNEYAIPITLAIGTREQHKKGNHISVSEFNDHKPFYRIGTRK